MSRLNFCVIRYIIAVSLSLSNLPSGSAQQKEFSLEIEILIQPSPSARLYTQTWGKVFFDMQRRAVFRGGRNGEKTRLEESESAGRRTVLAVGIMNRNGSITFREQTFVSTQPQPLAAWLDKLERYGTSGPPNESATWGLDDEQFASVLKMLSEPVTGSVILRSPMEAIDSLQLPSAFRIQFTDAGRRRAFPPEPLVTSTAEFTGLTKGSVLAAVLSRFGLGYRPKAGDRGKYVIEIDAGSESDNMYPVGWKNTEPITLVVPELAKSIPVDLEDAPLDALIDLIAQKLKRPHFYSTFELAAAGIDVTSIKYSRKPDKLTLYSLINIVAKTHHIGLSLRTDEAGSVFLWIATEEDEEAFRKRFAHVKPAL